MRVSPRSLVPFAALACTLSGASLAAQQTPLLLEAAGGIAAPTGSFSGGARPGEAASAGPSLSVLFVLPGQGSRGFYAGFSQHRFGCEDAGCATDGRYVVTGFDLGLRFALATEGQVVPWVRIGGVTGQVEADDLEGELSGVSDVGVGAEIGAGVSIGSGGALGVDPGVRFAALNAGLPGGETLRLRYLIAQVAVTLAF